MTLRVPRSWCYCEEIEQYLAKGDHFLTFLAGAWCGCSSRFVSLVIDLWFLKNLIAMFFHFICLMQVDVKLESVYVGLLFIAFSFCMNGLVVMNINVLKIYF